MNLLWNSPPEWWQYLGFCLSLIFVFHLGYGDGRSWLIRAFIGCLYALPLVFIGLNPWMALIPVVFFSLFWLSNKSGFFANTVVWKIVEYLTGLMIGVAVAYFVKDHEWLMIAAMTVGGVGFAAGGTHIPVIKGQKSIRRFLTPILLTTILWFGMKG